jgi:predicted ATPase
MAQEPLSNHSDTTPPRSSMAPMIGRTQELQSLQQTLAQVLSQERSHFIMLTGDAGVGKSRLVDEFSQYCRTQKVTLFSGNSLAAPQIVTYWVFLDLLRNSLNVTLDTPVDVVQSQLTAKIANLPGLRVEDHLPYLEHLLSLPPSDPAMARRIEFLDPSRLRQHIFLAVRAYLTATAQSQPLVLILEDMQWADDPSLDLLLYLLESMHSAPRMIISVSRSFLQGPLQRVRDWAAAHLGDHFQSIHLQHLSSEESHILLEQYLGLQNLSERMRGRIVERSIGIPFYLEEIVRMLIDAGVMQRVHKQWRIAGTADLATFGVPDTLHNLVLARYEHLKPVQRSVLQAACVIGHQFNRLVLHQVLPQLSEMELTQALQVLAKRGFINLPQDRTGNAYTFNHNLIAEAIYQYLPEPDRRSLHGQVGQALETLYTRQIDTQVDLLARHFAWSDHKERAVQYLLYAGQRAARSYINNQAQSYYQEALNLMEQVSHEPNQALRAYTGLGDVLLLIGEYPSARMHYEKALEIITPQPRVKSLGDMCGLLRRIGSTYERQGDYDQALRFLGDAKKMLADPIRPVPVEEAQVFNDTGWIYFRQGNFNEAESNLIHALPLAQQAGRLDITASIYNRLGGVYWQKDDLDKATNFVQKSLALREEIGDTVAVARSYNNLGLLDWKRGNWESALQSFRRCLALHANLGDVEGIIDVYGNLGLLQLERGEIQDAQSHFEAALLRAEQIGHSYITGMTLLYLSRLYVSTEAWQTALEYAERSMKAFIDIGARDELVDVYTNMGLACLGQDDLPGAAAWSEKAREHIPQTTDGSLLVRTDEGGRAMRLLGEISRLQNDHARADTYFTRCMDLFTHLGSSLELARTLVAQARLAADREDDTSGRILLNEARLIFRQLGANLELQKLEALSAQFGAR